MYSAAYAGQIASSRYAVPAMWSCRPIASMNSVTPWFIVTVFVGGAEMVCSIPQFVYVYGYVVCGQLYWIAVSML